MDFNGKNILVVGGSSGIGLSLVQLLHRQNANIYTVSRSASAEWPEDLHFLKADVLESLDAVELFLPEQLHGLVYSVGSITLKPFGRLTDEDFLKDFQLNVLGAAHMIRQAMKPIKNAGGSSIVLISSVAAKTGMPYHASIAAAKGAVEGMALSLAAELAIQHVRVNVVAPSLTDTPLAQGLLSTPEKREASGKRHPLGKIGQPEDISRLIAYLLSDDSTWMTGQVIGMDGGLGKLKTS
ncbi:SDR family oxidoreductase [Mucilaginibacter rubeus]|uniref:SDR family oxidoreductase n=1 Tax=Mucilaginibacter rubeus TaxID=2027860 RepID=A0AAE6JEP4_9SPHI|nr:MULTISPECIES: SDR family oxidoreductase [Mucilaginibacter]QEM03437.1 SDR family oxidoreductase [Mucilaginibacter rubeus]QEM16052.1 SDR family oxidoreductase [Mucilaginibacter gossypii]QTE41195.1 SDR family oxidoreductase [Mucilaginibacter rubeus]QTE47799.1 SDR family oxidoreductase [Mucilaginibacter rubeus]QTE59190.1 SDR family oxidoreductase [Mucilaginibacter rubeus]